MSGLVLSWRQPAPPLTLSWRGPSGEMAAVSFYNKSTGVIAAVIGPKAVNKIVEYTAVTVTPYTIDGNLLIEGLNIFGVDTGEDAIINLPGDAAPEKLIVVKNEMENFNVTEQVIGD